MITIGRPADSSPILIPEIILVPCPVFEANTIFLTGLLL
jgi:hypothetical protein